MTFFVDVDQTISTGHVEASVAESAQYYRDLGVIVPETVESWPDLFQLPDVLRQHELIPGALDGVRLLAEYGEIVYATVRKPDVARITRLWLAERGFPSPDRVAICRNVVHKLLALSGYPGSLVLVDDRWQKLLDCWPRLVDHSPRVADALRQRLTLVAFGAAASDLPESTVVPVVPLPDWCSVADVLTAVHEPVKKG